MDRLTGKAPHEKRLIGVVHLRPLPGSPGAAGADLTSTLEAAQRDAQVLCDAGFDGYVLENFGDVPFFKGPVPPHVLTYMTRVALALPRQDTLVGVNVLRNDARGALAVAAAADLAFIRINVLTGAMVTDQGIIEGKAAEIVRERARLAPDVAILADVNVKHAVPLGSGYDIEESARETAYRGLADGLIVTGKATGSPVDQVELERVRSAVPDRPLYVGSGVTPSDVAQILKVADGVIVGTALKEDGRIENAIDPERATAFVRAARG